MQDTSFSFSNPIPQKTNKISPTIVVGAVVLAVIIGTILIVARTKKPAEVKEQPEVVAETKEPTPTSKPKIDKKTVKIQVINGTGTPGQAGEVVTSLDEAGYDKENIKTGNADEFDNTTTTIEAKEGFEEIAKDIEKTLESTFDKITVKSTNLDNDSEYDIIVITGGKIYATPTPVATAAPTSGPTSTPTTTTTPTSTPTPTP